jgi:riboflavin kinase/FMN adenylyltransferase
MNIALGVFDGVHRGHQKIIEKAHRVLTFDPHPNRGVHLLTTLAERQDLIGNLDVIRFTDRIANMYPQDFIEGIIVKKFKPEGIIIGHDFAFGYNRSGNAALLVENTSLKLR